MTAFQTFFSRLTGARLDKRRRARSGALVILLCLLLLPGAARAACEAWVVWSAEGLTADAATLQADKPLDAINGWYQSASKSYIFFLPSGADDARLRLFFDGEATLNGEPIESGAETSALAGGATAVFAQKKAKYTLRAMTSGGLPSLFLSTASGSLKTLHASKQNEERGEYLLRTDAGALDKGGSLSQIKTRGNGTLQRAKKPYQIKLENGKSLLGMAKDKTWVLLANHFDNSLLRNYVAFELARAAGLAYTPESRFVDLYINGDFLGNYQLTSKVQVDDDRVAIRDLEEATEDVNDAALSTYTPFGSSAYKKNTRKGFDIPNDPADITGGYLVELELTYRYRYVESGVVTKKGQPIVIKSPKYASRAQVAYIGDFLQSVENALFANDGIDPTTGKYYTELVDLDSLVRKYMLEEIVKNYDGNRSSQFFYKPADSVSTKLYAGPAWDYDQAFGNQGKYTSHPSMFLINSNYTTKFFWYPRAYKHADFQAEVVRVYNETYLPLLNILIGEAPETDALCSIQTYGDRLRASAALNYVRWPVFNDPQRLIKTGNSYQANLDYLVTFLSRRMTFLAPYWETADK